MTYQLIYSSLSAIPMQRDELQELLDDAQRSNAKRNITGALVYVDGYFLQILEGDMRSVQALMARISRDVRHESVKVLQEGEIGSAVFSQWDMAFVSATPEQVAEWVGFTSKAAMPDLFDDMGRSRERSAHVAQRILSMLKEPVSR